MEPDKSSLISIQSQSQACHNNNRRLKIRVNRVISKSQKSTQTPNSSNNSTDYKSLSNHLLGSNKNNKLTSTTTTTTKETTGVIVEAKVDAKYCKIQKSVTHQDQSSTKTLAPGILSLNLLEQNSTWRKSIEEKAVDSTPLERITLSPAVGKVVVVVVDSLKSLQSRSNTLGNATTDNETSSITESKQISTRSSDSSAAATDIRDFHQATNTPVTTTNIITTDTTTRNCDSTANICTNIININNTKTVKDNKIIAFSEHPFKGLVSRSSDSDLTTFTSPPTKRLIDRVVQAHISNSKKNENNNNNVKTPSDCSFDKAFIVTDSEWCECKEQKEEEEENNNNNITNKNDTNEKDNVHNDENRGDNFIRQLLPVPQPEILYQFDEQDIKDNNNRRASHSTFINNKREENGGGGGKCIKSNYQLFQTFSNVNQSMANQETVPNEKNENISHSNAFQSETHSVQHFHKDATNCCKSDNIPTGLLQQNYSNSISPNSPIQLDSSINNNPTSLTISNNDVKSNSNLPFYELINPDFEQDGLKLKFRKSWKTIKIKLQKLEEEKYCCRKSPGSVLVFPANFDNTTTSNNISENFPNNNNSNISSSNLSSNSTPLMGTKRLSPESHVVIQKTSPHSDPDPETSLDYDSDCLVIVESDPTTANLAQITGNSQSPHFMSQSSNLIPSESKDYPHHTENTSLSENKLHNLPIHELKRKLAFCPECKFQHLNHKLANLCLSKHGKRQCWLCLEVMPNTKDSYFQHCARNHAIGQSNDIVGCPYCKKFFDFRQGFNQHIVKIHFSEDNSFVNTTACLSPGSLVDIYTGKPRPKQTNDHDEFNYTPEDGKMSMANQTASSPSSLIGIVNSQNKLNNSGASQEKLLTLNTDKLLKKGDDGGNADGGRLVSPTTTHQTRLLTRRESVIRETPQFNLNIVKSPDIISCNSDSAYNSASPQPKPGLLVSNYNTGTTGSGTADRGKQAFFISEKTASMTLPERPSSNNTLNTMNLNLHNNNNNNNISYISNTNDSPCRTTDFAGSNLPILSGYNNIGTVQQQHSVVPISNNYQNEMQQGLHFIATSPPPLLGMQKMLNAEVQMQYYNSVNNMLQTVADCRLKSPLDSNDLLQTQQQQSSSSPCLSPILRRSESSSASDSETFKNPTNIGVKRRILTKWDEHQEESKRAETQTSEIIPQQHRSSLVFDSELDRSRQILEQQGGGGGDSRIYRYPPQGCPLTPTDKHFWEQVLRESNAMYRNVNEQLKDFYSDGTPMESEQLQQHYRNLMMSHHHHHHHNPELLNYGGQARSHPHQYPRIMARVDTNGRPLGIFTSDGQPCVLTNNHQQPTNSQGRQNNYSSGSELQYQQRISQQMATNTGTSSQPQQEQLRPQNFSCSRKRKSSVPTRLVPNPKYDSVVVQNPFEDEDMSPIRSKKPDLSQRGNDQVVLPQPQPSLSSPTAQSRSQAIAQWNALVREQQNQKRLQNSQAQQRFVDSGGRLLHCHAKFTTGGQITDYSQQNSIVTPPPPQQRRISHSQTTTSSNMNRRESINNSSSTEATTIHPTTWTTSTLLPDRHHDTTSNTQLDYPNQPNNGNNPNHYSTRSPPTNSQAWLPFVVAPRYQEHCLSMLSRLKTLDDQRKVRMDINGVSRFRGNTT